MNKLVKELAELAKVKDVEAFAKALLSETDTDYDLNLGDLVVRTSSEDQELRDNLSKLSTKDKEKVFNDAFEIQIRNFKKDLGLEFEGKKPEDFLESYKSKVLEDAQVEPNKKVSELQTSLENLQKQLLSKDTEISEVQNAYKQKETRFKAQSLIPNLPENIGLSKEEATSLFFMNHEIKDDGVYKNGQLLKDKLENPIDLANSVTSWVTEKGWNTPEPPKGRGGASQGGQGTNKLSSMAEYEAHLQEKGINFGSAEANAILEKAAKDNPELLNE